MKHWHLTSLFCTLLLCSLLGLLPGCDGSASQQVASPTVTTLRIAAASDLKFALPQVIQQFEKLHTQIRVEPVFGSSGSLYSQISNQAPFDLFLSADVEYPAQLKKANLTLPDSSFSYAVGHLVIWVPRDSKLDISSGMKCLSSPEIHKVAIANPQVAPYGRAAVAALKSAGMYDEIQPKLVMGENMTQAAQFVESGAADVGLLGLSLALSAAMKDKGRFVELPAGSYPVLVQGGAILSSTRSPDAAMEFRAFLMSSEGQAILRQFGFSSPTE